MPRRRLAATVADPGACRDLRGGEGIAPSQSGRHERRCGQAVMPTTAGDWFVQLLIFTLIAYPIVGGIAFLVSSFYYHVFSERADLPQYLKHGEPFVTIFIPAHNEEESI